jgi:hypothetical protein
MRLCIAFLAILLLAGCGSGGGDDAAPTVSGPATTEVVTWHASGRIHERGQVLAGTDLRIGEWERHFDAEGSPLQWRGSYADGAVDAARPWSEWNLDGSVRVDATDR